jgi:hypothetical protein
MDHMDLMVTHLMDMDIMDIHLMGMDMDLMVILLMDMEDLTMINFMDMEGLIPVKIMDLIISNLMVLIKANPIALRMDLLMLVVMLILIILHITVDKLEIQISLLEDRDIIHPKDIVQILLIKAISLHKTK